MSDFYRRKIRIYFRRIDHNNDGLITEEQWLQMGEKYAEQADEETKKDVIKRLVGIFEAYNEAAGGHGKITEDELVEAFVKHRTDPKLARALEDAAELTFTLLDTDGDGFIQEAEYARLLYNMSIPDYEAKAKIAFADLDTDHDGKLSAEETKQGLYDFLLSEDETLPGTNFFGPF